MKKIEKLILPALFLLIVSFLYFSYFAPSDELGDFSEFDTNSNASVQIVVKYVKEKGINRSPDGGYIIYVVDRKNREVRVTGESRIPPGMNEAKALVLTGHLTKSNFHAHGIDLMN